MDGVSESTYTLQNINVYEPTENGGNIYRRDVYVKNGKILDVTAPRCVDNSAHTGLVIPGFFNLHCHLGENTFRNISGDTWTISRYHAYVDGYYRNLQPEERAYMWRDSAESVISESCAKHIVGMCASGSANLCKKRDMLNMSAFSIMSLLDTANNANCSIDPFIKYFREYNGEQCSVGASLHSIYKSDEAALKLARKVMDCGAEFFTVHISEDSQIAAQERDKFGKSPIEVLDEYGLLGERTMLIHCGYITDRDYEFIAKRGSLVVICPISNKFLNTKTADIRKLNMYGIKWTVATDGLATGRTFDLLKQCAELKKQFPELKPGELFYKITVFAAKFFNRSIYTGRIEKGTKADFIIIDYPWESPENYMIGLYKKILL